MKVDCDKRRKWISGLVIEAAMTLEDGFSPEEVCTYVAERLNTVPEKVKSTVLLTIKRCKSNGTLIKKGKNKFLLAGDSNEDLSYSDPEDKCKTRRKSMRMNCFEPKKRKKSCSKKKPMSKKRKPSCKKKPRCPKKKKISRSKPKRKPKCKKPPKRPCKPKKKPCKPAQPCSILSIDKKPSVESTEKQTQPKRETPEITNP